MVGRVLICLLALAHAAAAPPSAPRGHWVGTWACATQLAEPANRPPAPGLAGATLREVVRVSIGGSKVRLRLSNLFGDSETSLLAVHLGRSAGQGAIVNGSDREVTFGGKTSVTLRPGAVAFSDELDFDIPPLADIAISLRFGRAPHDITGHPGSRTTSFLALGDFVSASALPAPAKVDHWYFIEGLDVLTEDPGAAAVAVLGDSITDGRGSTTNGNDRWPDRLAQRLQARPAAEPVAVLNAGIGGNRLLHDGLGPSGLQRFERDVLGQPGVRWAIVFEGVNDLGPAKPRAGGKPGASPAELIAGFEQCIARAHAKGLKILGGTITAFEGFGQYFSPEHEAARQTINQWIRTSGQFDAVIDFDAATRDPASPSHLLAANDSGDHLHLNPTGYAAMARAIPLELFRP